MVIFSPSWQACPLRFQSINLSTKIELEKCDEGFKGELLIASRN